MKKITKYLGFILAFALIITSFAGCGNKSKNDIVGHWREYKSEISGLYSEIELFSDGSANLEDWAGSYSIDGDRIRLSDALNSSDFTFKVDGDMLILTNDSGKTATYYREGCAPGETNYTDEKNNGSSSDLASSGLLGTWFTDYHLISGCNMTFNDDYTLNNEHGKKYNFSLDTSTNTFEFIDKTESFTHEYKVTYNIEGNTATFNSIETVYGGTDTDVNECSFKGVKKDAVSLASDLEVLSAEIDDNGDYYVMVYKEAESFDDNSTGVGVIKNNQWLQEPSKDSYLKGSYENKIANYKYFGNGYFKVGNTVYKDNKEILSSVDLNRDPIIDFIIGDNLLIMIEGYNTDDEKPSIYNLETGKTVRVLGDKIHAAKKISKDYYLIGVYDKEKSENQLIYKILDKNGNDYLDITKYSTTNVSMDGNNFVIVAVKDNTRFKITLDINGNVISEEKVE